MLNRESQSDGKPVAVAGDWLQRRSVAFQIGLVLGLSHLLFILANIIGAIYYQEEHWHFFWILCGYLDFPVSLLLSKAILPVLSPVITRYDPYLAATGGVMFKIFLMFHLIIGSIWYCVLPTLVQKAAQKITTTRTGAIAAGIMMIIPIPANWFQLLRSIGGHISTTNFVLNSVLPGIWTVLFVWLFIINVRRKRLCWLLCLIPAVFCYLAGDIRYFILVHGR